MTCSTPDAGGEAAVPRLVPVADVTPLDPGHRLPGGVVEAAQREGLEASQLQVAVDADDLAVNGGGGTLDGVIEGAGVDQPADCGRHSSAARGEPGGPAGEVASEGGNVDSEDVLDVEIGPDLA